VNIVTQQYDIMELNVVTQQYDIMELNVVTPAGEAVVCS